MLLVLRLPFLPCMQLLVQQVAVDLTELRHRRLGRKIPHVDNHASEHKPESLFIAIVNALHEEAGHFSYKSIEYSVHCNVMALGAT